jgi:hypothetical protein
MIGVARLYGEPDAELAELSVPWAIPGRVKGIGAELLRRLIVQREKRIKAYLGDGDAGKHGHAGTGRKLGWPFRGFDSSQWRCPWT